MLLPFQSADQMEKLSSATCFGFKFGGSNAHIVLDVKDLGLNLACGVLPSHQVRLGEFLQPRSLMQRAKHEMDKTHDAEVMGHRIIYVISK